MRASRLIAGLVVVALVATVVFAVTQSLQQDDDGSTGDDPASAPTLAPTPTPEPGASEPPAADLASFYAQELTWELVSRRASSAPRSTVPIDYQDPGGETIELALLKDPADDPAQRVGSLVVNPGGPGAPGTSYAENASLRVPRRAPRRLRHRRLRPARHRRLRPGRLHLRRRARRVRRGRPRPGHRRRRGSSSSGPTRRFFQGCVAELRQPGRPRDHGRGGPRHGRAAGRAGRGADASTSVRPTAPSWARRTPTCSPTRSAGWCSTARSTCPSTRDSSASSRPAASRWRCGPTSQNCVDEGDCFLGDTVDEGLDDDPGPDRRHRRRSRCRPSRRPRARGRQRVLRAGRAALQPRLLADPRPGAARWRCDGDGTLLLRLSDAYASRNDDGTYSRQQRRGDPRDQLPRRPLLDHRRRGARTRSRRFEEASPTFGDVFAWGLVGCHGVQAEATEEAARDRRRGRRADRGRRHDPRPGDAVPVGRCTSPTSSSPACWSAATATGTPATTPATTASTRRSRTTSSTAPCPRTGSTLLTPLDGGA